MEEKWTNIIDYEDFYEVSENGTIRGKNRVSIDIFGFSHPQKERILKVGKDGEYFRCTLCKNGKPKHFFVHRLVWSSFNRKKISEGMVINHIDGNKINNNLSNLEVVTFSENTKKAHEIGLVKVAKGAKNGATKLKNSDIYHIYAMNKNGESNKKISKTKGLSHKHVSDILSGKKRKEIYRDYLLGIIHEDETSNIEKNKEKIYENEKWVHTLSFHFNKEYKISNFGRLMNLKNGKILKQSINKGYFMCNVGGLSRYIHRVVWESFNGRKIAKGMVIHHKDGNPTNNNIDNLEEVSIRQNMIEEVISGRFKSGNRKNSREDVFTILDLKNKGLLGTEISKITSKSLDVIYGIVNKKNYKDFIKSYEELNGVI